MNEPKVIWSEMGSRDGKKYRHAQLFCHADGGRTEAGYKGTTRDCVTRAIAIATGNPYQEVYDAMNAITKSSRGRVATGKARTGIFKKVYKQYLESIGWKWIPTMIFGQGCKVHLRSDELPTGQLIVQVSRHLVAVIDGVIHDNHDCSRRGTRCVYGYFSKIEL